MRTLRLLTAIGVCDEVSARHYRANDKTPVMASVGQIGGLRVSAVPVSTIAGRLEDYWALSRTGDSVSPAETAYSYTFGQSMYAVLNASPEHRADFDAYMRARKAEPSRRWHHTYPVMAAIEANSAAPWTIVDVGGSKGHDLQSFADSTPEFQGRLVLQDLPDTVAPLLEDKAAKRAFEPTAHDFFTPQPIRGAALYLLLACLHNWDDLSSIQILRHLAEAMTPNKSRLLVSAMLLPEYGAERRQAELDMQMWVLQGTRQRTEGEMTTIVREAGLEIVKIWGDGERESLVELKVPT